MIKNKVIKSIIDIFNPNKDIVIVLIYKLKTLKPINHCLKNKN
jgi:hypothetical protein